MMAYRRSDASAGKRASVRSSGGMALVLTLMIVAIITAMVVEFAYGIYTSTTSLSNWETSQQLSLAARSAVKLAASVVAQKGRSTATTGTFVISQKVHFGNLDTTITLLIEDENAKFNLNTLIYPNGQLNVEKYAEFVRLLKTLKLPTALADRIADWIDPDSEPRLADSEQGAKNSFLDSVDELLLIPGIDRKTYEQLLPYVTIYGSGYTQGLININDAAVPVLMSLSDDIDQQMAERVVQYRSITPFTAPGGICSVSGFENICLKLMNDITTSRYSFHVVATAQAAGVKRTIDSVLDLAGTKTVVRYWKEM